MNLQSSFGARAGVPIERSGWDRIDRSLIEFRSSSPVKRGKQTPVIPKGQSFEEAKGMIVALRRFEAGIDKLGRIGSVVAMRGAFTRWDDYTEPFRQEIRRRITRKMEMENAAVLVKEVKQDAARGRRKEEREMFREKMYEKRFADERAKGDSGLGPSDWLSKTSDAKLAGGIKWDRSAGLGEMSHWTLEGQGPTSDDPLQMVPDMYGIPLGQTFAESAEDQQRMKLRSDRRKIASERRRRAIMLEQDAKRQEAARLMRMEMEIEAREANVIMVLNHVDERLSELQDEKRKFEEEKEAFNRERQRMSDHADDLNERARREAARDHREKVKSKLLAGTEAEMTWTEYLPKKLGRKLMEDLDGGQHLRDMAADARIAPTAVDVKDAADRARTRVKPHGAAERVFAGIDLQSKPQRADVDYVHNEYVDDVDEYDPWKKSPKVGQRVNKYWRSNVTVQGPALRREWAANQLNAVAIGKELFEVEGGQFFSVTITHQGLSGQGKDGMGIGITLQRDEPLQQAADQLNDVWIAGYDGFAFNSRAKVWEEISWRPANMKEGDTVGILVANGDMVLYVNGEGVEVIGTDVPDYQCFMVVDLAGNTEGIRLNLPG